MSKKSAISQQFQINQSPLLTRLLLLLHSLAAFSSLANGLPWLYKLTILTAVSMSLWFNLRCYHHRFQTYQFRYGDDALWSMAITNNNFQPIKILPSSVITIWLIVLHFQLENGKRHSLVILNDALNVPDYRALAVTLKIAGLAQDED